MRSVCKRLATNILAANAKNKGSYKEREVNGELSRFYEYNELSLSLTKIDNKWKIDGLSFEVFGNEFFLTVDGSVSMVVGDEGNEQVFTVKDEKLIKSLSVFLEWRNNALEELDV